MRALVRSTLAVLAASACASGSSPERPTADVVRPARPLRYDEDPAGREVVARVDGVPIYADCVATQAAFAAPGPRGADDDARRRAALDECVAFELLAQEARRRGQAADPDASLVQQREAVRALIERDFTPSLDGPEDVPRADVERYWPKLSRFFNHDELRTTYHCRFKLKRGTVTNGPEDLEAKRQAEALSPKMAGRRLEYREFKQLCGEASLSHAMEINKKPYTFERGDQTHQAYADAARALTPGYVSPPVRTSWGWDLIYLTEVAPAVHKSFADAEPDLRRMFFYDPDFEGYRENRFLTWSSQFGGGLAVKVYPERIPRAEDIQAKAIGAAAADPTAPTTDGDAPEAP